MSTQLAPPLIDSKTPEAALPPKGALFATNSVLGFVVGSIVISDTCNAVGAPGRVVICAHVLVELVYFHSPLRPPVHNTSLLFGSTSITLNLAVNVAVEMNGLQLVNGATVQAVKPPRIVQFAPPFVVLYT